MTGMSGTSSWPNQPEDGKPRRGKEVAGCEFHLESKGSLVIGCEFRIFGTRQGRGDPANGESRFARSRGWTVRSRNRGSFFHIRTSARDIIRMGGLFWKSDSALMACRLLFFRRRPDCSAKESGSGSAVWRATS